MVDGGIATDVPIIRTKLKPRKPSERIIKIKLRNLVFDKDGCGSKQDKPVNLEQFIYELEWDKTLAVCYVFFDTWNLVFQAFCNVCPLLTCLYSCCVVNGVV